MDLYGKTVCKQTKPFWKPIGRAKKLRTDSIIILDTDTTKIRKNNNKMEYSAKY